MEPAALLEDLLGRVRAVRAGGELPQVIFDLDGTLFDNGPRTWRLVAEALDAGGHQEARERLNSVSDRMLPYLVTDFLQKADIVGDEVVEEVKAYWFERFFSDEYQHYDYPMEGSVQFVQRLYEAGATIVYLTGRDVPGMLVGCADALRASGYPVGLTRTMMMLKPDSKTKDLAFKQEACGFLSETGTVVAAFDNEPGNCNLFLKSWPDACSVFLATTHAPNPPALESGVVQISQFE